jgi:hypothetical protein
MASMNPRPSYDVAPRELCSRSGDGIEVALLWTPGADHVQVAGVDTKLNDAFQISVAGCDAMHAFHHPFAHADSGVSANEAVITAPSIQPFSKRLVDR